MTKKEAISFIKEMYEEVLIKFNIEKVEAYFSPDYQQVTDGKVSTLDEFKKHLSTLKGLTKQLEIPVFHDVLFDEDTQQGCFRYTVNVELASGDRGLIDVMALFTLLDGRIIRCDELTRSHKQHETLEQLGHIS
ncbi:nuclear transport factor 2 family protein [Bacillus pumilus]|uniref:nuclear transport factor 2 family protein n=1 Tax=Bacillus TaxID=1386 RepID=UPI000FDC0F01|nr:nuclear transport factor 2 family protein [Bacillus pumilus]AZV51615.1 nuclear transport factor 2 family protein [Bacillus pumilus]MBU5257749.1 nuclear transport factor 2 family protein [Bacillus pumilus]QZD59109.1 nuclear transport factor 2 family protein [Bacillus pumilus]UCZ71672.1 nuclear transport factor 2 family protein [Bacillus pumilus]WOP21524.1 nuclear transport factor 2 family protein [Bacillus pumilus]